MSAGQGELAAQSARSSMVLGIDGGGTKTAAWLAEVDAAGSLNVLGRGAAGASNPLAVGLETARQHLAEAVAAVRQDAGAGSAPVAVAVLALAGTGRADMAAAVVEWAQHVQLAERIELVHDADAVLAGGTPDGLGVALIAGTGSAAIAVTADRVRHVCGGWGFRFGDEGGGYWLGREALAAVARASDGRDAPTELTDLVLAHFRLREPRDVNSVLAAAKSERTLVADLAPLAVRAAEAGDAAAGRLLDRAADHLAELIVAAARQANFASGFPLALAGGVVCRSSALRDRLAARLADGPASPGDVCLVENPVVGCLRIAGERLLRETRSTT